MLEVNVAPSAATVKTAEAVVQGPTLFVKTARYANPFCASVMLVNVSAVVLAVGLSTMSLKAPALPVELTCH